MPRETQPRGAFLLTMDGPSNCKPRAARRSCGSCFLSLRGAHLGSGALSGPRSTGRYMLGGGGCAALHPGLHPQAHALHNGPAFPVGQQEVPLPPHVPVPVPPPEGPIRVLSARGCAACGPGGVPGGVIRCLGCGAIPRGQPRGLRGATRRPGVYF